MYQINKRKRDKYRIIVFLFVFLPLACLVAGGIWFFVLKDTKTVSSNFIQENGDVATVTQASSIFTTNYYSITLPDTWEYLGKMNPFVDQMYFKYHDKDPLHNNRLLEIFVNAYPPQFSVNRILPVQVVNNRLVPGDVSDDCSSFNGAPSGQSATGAWIAKWQNITFNCSINQARNYLAAATVEDGIGIPLTGAKSGLNHYLLLYIDQNASQNYSVFGPMVKSFEVL